MLILSDTYNIQYCKVTKLFIFIIGFYNIFTTFVAKSEKMKAE